MAAGAHALSAQSASVAETLSRVRAEVHRVIVGQEALIERLMVGMLCNGHILVEGVPGLAKTLTVSTLARALDLQFVRIQFTPDLLPADLIGSEIFSQADGRFTVRRGPIFANLVLADEVNRAPAKVQSALLEAMQERQVSIGGQTMPLDEPFLVMATQNPIEQEGTYPLPEAQLDRFLFLVKVDYPTSEEEDQIMRLGTGDTYVTVDKVLHGDDILRLQHVVRRVPVADHVFAYAKNLARLTRPVAAS
ncbi:MAG TPA: AAA family ATPase [Tepidiformaceae bacterium]|nr:AAA family ATPase [Tepidiformaceae bacterium]